MYKYLRRLFVRPTIRELLEEELYQTKVSYLEACKLAAHWGARKEMFATETARLTDLRTALESNE